ncbi:protein THEMIS3-like [Latimeria chalumnae]|uniref:CABIT domain-containing protein n=1 Tax=Latimeria chalumnae TaxID=7897 RepID=H3ASS3_LATCH|nr:PREDICTED: protein THEMIS3-like [Latimeria chalumnae]|eukprot:XP_014350467.1 PREDICTED: protein THEMIS3-like [Latimeria chalumnae]
MEQSRAQSWNSFISSLSPNNFNKTIKVITGEYLTGSLYSLSFSEGDVIKITELIVFGAKAELYQNHKYVKTVDIPPGYKGEFQLVADPNLYETVADLIQHVKIGNEKESQPLVQNNARICFSCINIEKETKLCLLGLEEAGSETFLKCKLLKNKKSPTILLPMNCRGQFQECQEKQSYSMDAILKWKLSASYKRMVIPVRGILFHGAMDILPEEFNGYLRLLPNYLVKGVLSDGTETIIPADIDMQIVDISDSEQKNTFTTSMSLQDVYWQASAKFPLTVRIVDVRNDQLLGTQQLKQPRYEVGDYLTILRKESLKKYLVMEITHHSSPRYFLVSSTYQGIFQRVPRVFQFVYDVELARQIGNEISVIAHKDYVAETSQLSSFKKGDGFRALGCGTVPTATGGKVQNIEVLECENILTHVKVKLPLYAEGNFSEITGNNDRGYIMDQLYLKSYHAKVIAQDCTLQNDPLCSPKELKIAHQITEECLMATYEGCSSQALEIPVNRVNLLVKVIDYSPLLRDTSTAMCPFYKVEILSAADYQSLISYEELPQPPPVPPRSSRDRTSNEYYCSSVLPKNGPSPPTLTEVTSGTLPALEKLFLVQQKAKNLYLPTGTNYN